MKKLLAAILSVVMVMVFMPAAAFAADDVTDNHSGAGLYYSDINGDTGLLVEPKKGEANVKVSNADIDLTKNGYGILENNEIYNIPVTRGTTIKIHYFDGKEIKRITSLDSDVAPSGLFSYVSDAHKKVKVTFTKLWSGDSFAYANRVFKLKSTDAEGKEVILKVRFVNAAAVEKVKEGLSSVKCKLVKYNSVKVYWNKIKGAQRYAIYMAKGSEGSYSEQPDVITADDNYTFTGLAAGTTYSFKVVPIVRYLNSVQPGLSNYKAIYTLKKVGSFDAEKSSGKVKLSWGNINGETGYQISKSTKSDGTNIVSTIESSTVKASTMTVTKGKTYYYKVRAYKKVGSKKVYGPWSETVKYKLI